MYDMHLRSHAPNCVEDRSGAFDSDLLTAIRNLCPLSCGVCKNDALAPKRRDGHPRGHYFPSCDLPQIVKTSPENATVRGVCTLCSNVTIQSVGSLHVKGDGTAAEISGGDATQHFLVFGELVLEDIVLSYGFSPRHGGAILIDGTQDNIATAILLRTTIRDCEAFKNGGGVAVLGQGASLLLSDHSVFMNNIAQVEGGALYVDRGAKVTVSSASRSSSLTSTPSPTLSVIGAKNRAEGNGGFIYCNSASKIKMHGRGVIVSLRNNTAAVSAGAIAAKDGCLIEVAGGAALNIAQSSALVMER